MRQGIDVMADQKKKLTTQNTVKVNDKDPVSTAFSFGIKKAKVEGDKD